MSILTNDLPSLVLFLVPGFVAAGVFYALTAHPKASEFERVIQALVFTTILTPVAAVVRWFALVVGRAGSLGEWTKDSEVATTLLVAVALGVSFGYVANKDAVHRWLRMHGWTTRTSYPSEWYATFIRERRWIVLHLEDGRRLYGWPEEWPDQSEKGHFAIDQPEWLLENNERAPLHQVEKILIPATDVKMVEFVKEDREVSEPIEELERVKQLLAETKQGVSDGSEGTTTGSKPSSG